MKIVIKLQTYKTGTYEHLIYITKYFDNKIFSKALLLNFQTNLLQNTIANKNFTCLDKCTELLFLSNCSHRALLGSKVYCKALNNTASICNS